MTQQIPADLPAPFRLARMITGLWVPQTIYTAAALGLAMADGPTWQRPWGRTPVRCTG